MIPAKWNRKKSRLKSRDVVSGFCLSTPGQSGADDARYARKADCRAVLDDSGATVIRGGAAIGRFVTTTIALRRSAPAWTPDAKSEDPYLFAFQKHHATCTTGNAPFGESSSSPNVAPLRSRPNQVIMPA